MVLGADVDEVLVVDGALGEQQAGPLRPCTRSAGPGGRRARWLRARPRLPRRVDQPGQAPAQRSGEGAGPAHAGNARWRPPRDATRRAGRNGAGGTLGPCSPSPGRRLRPRAPAGPPAIDRRQFLQLSALGAAGLRRRRAGHGRTASKRPPARARRPRRPRRAGRRRHRRWPAASSCPPPPGSSPRTPSRAP